MKEAHDMRITDVCHGATHRLQAWAPQAADRALQMHCWFLSALVLYWILFGAVYTRLRTASLRLVAAGLTVLAVLPWAILFFPAVLSHSPTWYQRASQHSDVDVAVRLLLLRPSAAPLARLLPAKLPVRERLATSALKAGRLSPGLGLGIVRHRTTCTPDATDVCLGIHRHAAAAAWSYTALDQLSRV
jgi:hypothetical protein